MTSGLSRLRISSTGVQIFSLRGHKQAEHTFNFSSYGVVRFIACNRASLDFMALESGSVNHADNSSLLFSGQVTQTTARDSANAGSTGGCPDSSQSIRSAAPAAKRFTAERLPLIWVSVKPPGWTVGGASGGLSDATYCFQFISMQTLVLNTSSSTATASRLVDQPWRAARCGFFCRCAMIWFTVSSKLACGVGNQFVSGQ